MAKEKKADIKFDKLSNLNLVTQANLEEVKATPKKVVEPEKQAAIEKPEPRKKKAEIETIKTSFKIEKELHLALKQYCLLQGEDMATVVFEQVIKSFLKRKGYYPVSKK